MGDIWAHRLPEFLDDWNVPTLLSPGWEARARGSGGFSTMRGISVHHSASTVATKLATSVRYVNESSPTAPMANGLVSRTKDGPVFVLCAAGATNTSGRGGPRLSSRGVISRDTANSTTFGIEAENTGRTELWDDAMCDVYVRACCAVLSWANECTPGPRLGPGDVFAHFEWAPTRKIDPAGPARFNDFAHGKWNMDRFRGEVFLALIATPVATEPDPSPQGPPVGHGESLPPCGMPPPLRPGSIGDDVHALQWYLWSRGWYSASLDGIYGPVTSQAVQRMQRYLRNVGFIVGPIDGWYGEQTREASCVSQGFAP